VHVVANAALLGLGYAWLWMPDERIWQLVLSAILVLVWLAGALWLHGGTLAFFREMHRSAEARLWPAFRASLRRLPALAVWAVILLLVLWLVDSVTSFPVDHSPWLASWLTMTFRKPVSPQSVASVFSAIAWFADWFVVPLALLSLAVGVTVEGLRAFGREGLQRAWKLFWRLRFWLAYAVLFAVGAYVPYRLTNWVPEFEGFFIEAVSLVIRFLLAYALAVTVWLALLSLLGRMAGDGDPNQTAAGEPESTRPAKNGPATPFSATS
jgi:hypothetical protein